MTPRCRLILPLLAGICAVSIFLLWRQNPWLIPSNSVPDKIRQAPQPMPVPENYRVSSGKPAPSRETGLPSGRRVVTVSKENAGQIREDIFNGKNQLTEIRIFTVDDQGRLRNGVIYNGRKKPTGSVRYTYDPHDADRLMVEELFNKKGQRVRVLYYPGALKDPKFTGRMVAFSFNPDKPAMKKVELKGEPVPILPGR